MLRMIKKKFRETNYFLFALTQILFRSVVCLYNIIGWSLKGRVKLLFSLDSLKVPRSKSVYILGGGSSTNDYTDDKWRAIKNGVSIGINYWLLNDFVPTILMLELFGNERHLEKYQKIICRRKSEFSKTIFIIKGNHLFPWEYSNITKFIRELPTEIRNNTYLTLDTPIPGENIDEFKKSLSYLAKFGFFKTRHRVLITGHPRATLGLAITFSIQLGFNEIILCGIDLNNTQYFYDEKPHLLTYYGIEDHTSGQSGPVHLTNIQEDDAITISQVITILKQQICERAGIKLSVGSIESALYPDLPYYFEKVSMD